MARVWLAAIGILAIAPYWAYGQNTGGVRVPTGGVPVPTGGVSVPTGGVHVPYPANPNSTPSMGNGSVFPPNYGYGYGPYRPPVNINYNPPIYFGYNGYGYSAWSPPLIVASPGIAPYYYPYSYPYSNYSPVYTTNNNYYVAPPQNKPQAAKTPARPSAKNIAKGKEYIERGDRFFQTNKNAQAKDRYLSALKSDPTASDALARLATMALVKGDRAEALGLMHEAIAANPDWLANPANIQAMFAEPAEFHKLLGDLEADVQAHPDDRQGWMLLGIELYLSGRVDRAKDVFLRLDDRKPDPTLSAFLTAVKK